MRKITALLIGVVALAVIGGTLVFFALSYFVPVQSTVEPAAAAEQAAPRPAINVLPGMGGGKESAAYDLSMPVPTFANATFRLDVTLPDTVPTSTVWQQASITEWTEAEMSAIAIALGFDGTFYTEQMPGGVGYSDATVSSTMAEPAVSIMPAFGGQSQIAVDGLRRLTFYPGGFSYSDPGADPNYSGNQALMPYEQAQPIAEAFFRDAGLLDMPYQLRRGWGDEVQLVRQLDGLWLERNFAIVTVAADGDVLWADYSRLENLRSTESGLPVISAQRAYEILTANADMQAFTYYPSDAQRQREREQVAELMTFRRTYAPGQAAELTTWLQVLTPIAGGTPIISAENMRITGDEALLSELAAQSGQGVRLTGRFGGTPDALTFEVESWSQSLIVFDQRLSGAIRRTGETVILVVNGGLEVELPGAPADLADGATVGVYGWSISPARDGALPQFDWTTIDRLVEQQPIELVPPAGPYDSPNLNVTAVDLVVNSTYISETLFGSEIADYAGEQFAQAWRFTTVNDAGDTLIFFVPALEIAQR